MDKNILSDLSYESKKIMGLLLHNKAMTKSELSELSGLKLTSLNRVMQPLETMKVIEKSQIGESTGGRKPIIFDVNSARYYIIGIDISRLYTQVVLINLKLQILEKYRFDMGKEFTPGNTLNLIFKWIGEVLEKVKKKDGKVIGIGIGAVGPLDRNRGIVLNPENFEALGWENIQLKSIFEKRFKIPVVIDNGANAAVLAETIYGIGKGIRNVIYVNCGIGIRTGVLSSGVFVRNINDAEDAFAHMVIDVNGEKCPCGNRGCIEKYSSIHSITERFSVLINKSEETEKANKNIPHFSYIDICKAAEINHTEARQVITNAAEIMGNGLANLIRLLNPGLVILSGQLIKNSELFYKICTETAISECIIHNEGSLIFSRGGHFGDNAISIGSAAMVLENFLGNTE